jgi:hypothetical protein
MGNWKTSTESIKDGYQSGTVIMKLLKGMKILA